MIGVGLGLLVTPVALFVYGGLAAPAGTNWWSEGGANSGASAAWLVIPGAVVGVPFCVAGFVLTGVARRRR